MNTIKITLLIAFSMCFKTAVWAKPFSNMFIGYIIRPAVELDWSSPKSLAITSAISSRSSAYAPIGHFAAEIKCDKPNKYGISHAMTGMETFGDNISKKLTLKKKLGLGTLFYTFPGDLQSAEYVKEVVAKAKKDGRLVIVKIPTSPERCQKGLEFIEKWIDHGSYTVYGANKNTKEGEGAGCADFAMELFQIATSIFPRDALLAKVLIPYKLIGDGEDKKVPFWNVLVVKKWADNEIDGKPLMIMDTNKTIKFLFEDSKVIENQYTYVKHLIPETTVFTNNQVIDNKEELEAQTHLLSSNGIENYNFTYHYPQRESSQATWERIAVKK